MEAIDPPADQNDKASYAASRSVALQTLLIGCRLDLDTLQREANDDDGGLDRLGLVERRLRRVTERLERAVAALAQAERAEPAAAQDAVLASENDHRIKNSLQVVMMLLQRQARNTARQEAREALRAAAARVDAIAQVHVCLQAAGGTSRLDLANYLKQICAGLEQAFRVDDEGPKLQVALAPLLLTADRARAVGLIVNELVTNALRHGAAPGRDCVVRVRGDVTEEGYRLVVEDDGVGLPPGFDIRTRQANGMGLRLIKVLVEQLRARMTAETRPGACFTLVLPLSDGE